ncbi:MAG TPA: FtsX-like permease family protein [Saprospiraceae bacterium]|nr:FtsX-like permease family protein [Saprospiraceae bacterium]HND87362.1 FtsX-like permease family protein [Saprospiraceae bacterium]HNG88769.1 FtsX-like permease family protein [Saprospiraceae bacterium]
MHLPFFIARRLAFSGGKNFSRVVIRIAIAAVSLSVAVMIASTALIAGFKSEISRKIFEFWGHLHISDVSFTLSFEPKPISLNQPFYPSLEQLRTLPPTEVTRQTNWLGHTRSHIEMATPRGGVKHIQVFAHKPGIIRTKTEMEGILLKGVGQDFDWANLRPYLLEGSPISHPDSAPSRDIIISRQTADRLQVGVGDKFIVYFVKQGEQLKRLFQVCGIYKTGLEEYDRKFALCDLRQVQQLLGWQADEVAGFEVWLDDIRDIDLYNEHIYNEVLPPELLSTSIRDKFPAIFEWLQLQDYNEIVILSLMLAVAIVNMITALLVLVLERSTMIGVLKALGEANSRVRQIFLYYAAVITTTGMFFGNLIGLGFCWLQDRFRLIRLNEADYYLSYAPVKINWLTVLGINVGTLVITLIFLLLPSLAVTKIEPVRAIRFK